MFYCFKYEKLTQLNFFPRRERKTTNLHHLTRLCALPPTASPIHSSCLGLLVGIPVPDNEAYRPRCCIRNKTAPQLCQVQFSYGDKPAGFFSSEGPLPPHPPREEPGSTLNPCFRNSCGELLLLGEVVWRAQRGAFPLALSPAAGTVY